MMTPPIRPILSALRRHKAGTVLIALQIALTLTVVCNALFIIHRRISNLSRPTGIDELDTFAIESSWIGKPGLAEAAGLINADLVALRRLPTVQDAAPLNSYPLGNWGWVEGLTLKPDQRQATTDAAIYFSDEHALATLGLTLLAGRNFRADEISRMDNHGKVSPPVIIVTRALANRLFPNDQTLGKTVYLNTGPALIIGIVKRLQGPSVDDKLAELSMLVPILQATPDGSNHLIRAKPGQMDDAMREAPKALFAKNRLRTMDPVDGIRRFEQIRASAYAGDRGMAIMMGVICVVLLAITAAGIVGLTSFWVGQRRKQIGVRRALGATRGDILGYFLTENFLISFGGVVVGVVLAVGINLWMVTRFEMGRLSLGYVLDGVIVLIVLGQLATLAPALRASRVSPVEATRSV
jgi:putative ABC transport system permease protein